MAPRLASVLLAAMLSATGALAQTRVIQALWPEGANPTETILASVISVDAAKQETALLLACGGATTRSGGEACGGIGGATYRTSPGGMGLTMTLVDTSPNTTVSGSQTVTRFMVTTSLTLAVNCAQPTNPTLVTCQNSFGGFVAASTFTEPINSTPTSEVFTAQTHSAAITITGGSLPGTQTTPTTGSTTSTSRGGAAAQKTQNAMLAGAIVVLGGAMLV